VVLPISLTCSVRFDPTALTPGEETNRPPTPDLAPEAPEFPPERESLRVLLIGSRKGVISTIQTLYRLGFAEVAEWSPLLPAPNPGEVMSILTRYLLTQPPR
jgi:hypothetical protein